jgi:hypothetical protein
MKVGMIQSLNPPTLSSYTCVMVTIMWVAFLKVWNKWEVLKDINLSWNFIILHDPLTHDLHVGDFFTLNNC